MSTMRIDCRDLLKSGVGATGSQLVEEGWDR
jgi:hypothetical protein